MNLDLTSRCETPVQLDHNVIEDLACDVLSLDVTHVSMQALDGPNKISFDSHLSRTGMRSLACLHGTTLAIMLLAHLHATCIVRQATTGC